jgi:DNA-binding transcriptional regulator YhcF (GntR family)
MTSLRKALGLKWEGYSPESKFVYLKLVNQQLNHGKIVEGLVDLSNSINVNKKTLSNAITDLKNKNLISTKKVNGKGIHSGRKKVSIDLLPLETDTIFTEELLIANIIKSTSIDTSDKKRKTNSSLLLLVIIIASKANEFGTVTDLPKSTMKQLTGITDSRLKSQLSKLLDMGVIRSVVPGLSGKYAFGKTSSYYFIDLNHHLIALCKDYLILEYDVICYTNSLGAKLFSEYSSVIDNERRKRFDSRTQIYIERVPFELNRSLFEFFKDKNVRIFSRYFQTRIEQISSNIINSKNIKDYDEWGITEALVEQMFLPKHMQNKHSMAIFDVEPFKRLIQQVVIEYSKHIKNIIDSVYGEFGNQMKHMIIPSSHQSIDASSLKVISLIESRKDIPTQFGSLNAIKINKISRLT